MEASSIVRPTLTAKAFSISRGRKCFWEGCVASYLITYPNEDSTKVDSVCEVSLPLSLNPFGRTVEDVDLKEFVKLEATKLVEMGAVLPCKLLVFNQSWAKRLCEDLGVRVFIGFFIQLVLWWNLEKVASDFHGREKKADLAPLLMMNTFCGLWIYRAWMLLLAVHTGLDYINWRTEYRKKRRRSDPKCISNSRRPKLLGKDGGCADRYSPSSFPFDKLEDTSRHSWAFTCPEVHVTEDTGTSQDLAVGCVRFGALDENSKRLHTFPSSPTCEKNQKPGSMDHIYMSFGEYLYVGWLLRPGAMVLFLVGILKLLLLRGQANVLWTLQHLPKLHGPGLRMWQSVSFIFHCMINKIQGEKNFVEANMEIDGKAEERLVCFILEHLAVMVRDIREDNQGLFGKLQMENVLHCRSDGSGHTEVGTLSIELDISNKRIVSKKKIKQIKYKDIFIHPQDALCLCFVAFVGLVHPVAHCFANWAVVTEFHAVPFLRLSGLITLKYNNLGAVVFPRVMRLLKQLGVTKFISHDQGLLSIQHGEHTVPEHKQILAVAPHSNFVRFIADIRGYFHLQFAKYREDFPGVDPEAFFLATIYHSCDHRHLADSIEAADLSYFDQEYEADLELAQVILNCFVDKPPFRLFDNQFSSGPHPLFKEVHAYACQIDKKFATYMETSIAM